MNTLRYARRLKAAGLPDDQAEEMAEALGEELVEHLATKADLLLLKWMIGFNLAFSCAILWRILDMS
ncbi:MAG: integrase [Gammaproteobacteria bacterium]|nr:integrase [Gammaproteobacteria bacterium]